MVVNNETIYEFYCRSDEKTRQQFWQDWLILTQCRREDEN